MCTHDSNNIGITEGGSNNIGITRSAACELEALHAMIAAASVELFAVGEEGGGGGVNGKGKGEEGGGEGKTNTSSSSRKDSPLIADLKSHHKVS